MSPTDSPTPTPEPIILTVFGSGEYSQGKPFNFKGGWPEFYASIRNAKAARTTDKKMLLSWSPTTFDAGKRLIRSAKTVCACVLDYDGGETTLEGALALWSGTTCFGHTSWSATATKETFRIVLPYPRVLTVADHERVRQYVWRTAQASGHVLDKSCKDVSRLWYLGNNGRHYRTLWQDGAPLDVDDILALADVEDLADEVVPEGHIVTTTVAEPGSPEAIEQARRYLGNKVGAVAGQGGHGTTRGVAVALVWGFGLSEEQALSLMSSYYNPKCQPPWTEKELAHKVEGGLEWARGSSGGKPRGHFLQRRVLRSPAPPSSSSSTARSSSTSSPSSSTASSPGASPPSTRSTTTTGETALAVVEAVDHEGVFEDVPPQDVEGEVLEGEVVSPSGTRPSRPEIPVTTEEHEVNDQAVAALSLDPALYARGSVLVRVQRGTIAQLPMPILRERMAAAATWLSYIKKEDAWAKAHPPDWSVSAVYHRGE